MYAEQLQWIQALQAALRSLPMDVFFRAWGFVDSTYFVVFSIALVWYLWSRQVGVRLFYVLVLSLVFNFLLKSWFDLPRPCQIDPSVGILCVHSPGLPSGAAQTATILCGVVWLETRRTLYRVLALIFAACLCFSRIYLGVHFPTDVLGGIFVGGVLLALYRYVFPRFRKQWKGAAFAFPFFLLCLEIWFSPRGGFYFFFATLGVAVGLMQYEKLAKKQRYSLLVRGEQVVIVVAGLAFLFLLQEHFPAILMVWAFVAGYWLSFLGGWWIPSKIHR
jgi:membrane-associated phospholipid phosphatase